MIRRPLIAFFILFCSYSTITVAQNGSLRTSFLIIDSLYNSGSYLRAEVEARRMLEYANLNDTAYAEIHKYIAFSLVAQGKIEFAKEQFTKLLTLQPAYSLDPVLTSPKILAIFIEVKQAFLSSKKPQQETKIIPLKEERSSTSFRTVLFPGWEQLNRGRKTSGIIFGSLGIVTMGGGITFEFLRSSARQNYLNEKDPLKIDDKYKIYNSYYKAEIASFVAFALTYIASEIDVFTTTDNPSMNVMSNLQPDDRLNVTLMLKF